MHTLTDLAGDIYKAADIVGREIQGFITSVTVNSGSEAAARGDTVRSHFTRQPVLNTNVTPSMTIPEGDDQIVDNKTMTVNQIANVQIPWEAEEARHLNNGSGFETVYGDMLTQAFRVISNQIESHVATVAYQGASRAVGVAGTTPFGANHHIINQGRQVIVDNGMPFADGMLSMVMSTTAGTNLRNLSNLYKVNEAGNDRLLRQGVLQDISSIMLKESAQVKTHAVGAGSGYLVNDAGATLAVGSTAIPVDTGTGVLVAGDTITFAGDGNVYVVAAAYGGGAGSIEIASPGLRQVPADNAAITVGTDPYAANVLLHQSAVELVMRPLEKPFGGDAAVDEMIVQDAHSGLTFRISDYRGYNKAMIDITTLYDARAWKPDAIALIQG